MSNRATTAAKGRPKKSYASGKSRKEEDPEAMILWMPDETFCEEVSEWVDSPEGQLWLDMSDTLEVPLKHVGLDVRQRKFLWPDAKRLDLDQSVRRIIPLPDHFECATGSSPLSKYRLPGSDSIQTDLGSVSISSIRTFPKIKSRNF